MLERDKALKLELDVATSLNKDMTMRLAMTQRTVKQLHEKLSAMDAAEAASRQQHEAALHEKVRLSVWRSTWTVPFLTLGRVCNILFAGGGADSVRSQVEKCEQENFFRKQQTGKHTFTVFIYSV